MNDLMASLGLDDVSSDTNSIPDNTYDCFVADVQYVWIEAKNRLSDVITYQVEFGDHKGSRIPHWFSLGTDASFDAEGNPNGYKPNMNDKQKQFYKKAFTDLGIPENEVNAEARNRIVGQKCTVTVKTNAKDTRYQNVTSVKVRNGQSGTQSANEPVSLVRPSNPNPEFTVDNAAASNDLASQL